MPLLVILLFCIYSFDAKPYYNCRPHDRVPLKDMKTDWHACLDNKVGFKV